MRPPISPWLLLLALAAVGCRSNDDPTGAAGARSRGASAVPADPEPEGGGGSVSTKVSDPLLNDAREMARVNGRVLSLREVRHAIGPAYEEYLRDREQLQALIDSNVQSLVLKRLIVEETKRYGLEIPEESYESEMRRLEKEAAGRRTTLEQTIKDYGMTRREFEQGVRDDLRYRFGVYMFTGRYDRPPVKEPFRPAVDLTVTPSEVREWGGRHPEVAEIPEAVTLRAVELRFDRFSGDGVPSRQAQEACLEACRSVRDRILSGEDMAALARDLSQGRDAEQGGLWEPFGRDSSRLQVVKEWAFRDGRAAGDVSEPLPLPTGYVVLRVEEYTPAHTAPIEEWGPRVRELLTSTRRDLAFVEVQIRLVEDAALSPPSLRSSLLDMLRRDRRILRERLK